MRLLGRHGLKEVDMEKVKGNKHGNCVCAGCGGHDLRMAVWYDGMDCDSEAGEGSGYKYVVDLYCEDCGRVYPVCRVKDSFAVSDIKDFDKEDKDEGKVQGKDI
jgi:hypothetical protein